MHHIVYFSSATYLMPQDDLRSLLEQSRVANQARHVTGLLLYRDGNIVQVLEGEEEVIRPLYEKIVLDPRHKGAIVVLDEPIPHREFPDWSMGFRQLSGTEPELAGYNDFLARRVDAGGEPTPPDATICRRILEIFRRQR